MSHFEELLKGLSSLVGSHIRVDSHGKCDLIVNQTLRVQLSLDRIQENLLIASLLGEISAGKFRETILKNTLKSNFPFPRDGVLSYCDKNNQLALFAYLPLQDLSSEKLYEFLKVFIPKADEWRKKILSGQP